MEDFGGDKDRIARCRKPVVAAVAGFALGGGCEFAMQADIIIAADNAKFGQPEIKLGVIPGYGGTQRLTHAVGKAKAMDLILTGRMMDAAEAERAGLVARVVPAASLMDEAMKVAETIAGMGLPSVYAAKDSVNRAFETTLGRRRALRAPRVPGAVRHRRPEGRHDGLHREAAGEVQEQVAHSGYFPDADHPRHRRLDLLDAGLAGGRRHVSSPRGNCGCARPARSPARGAPPGPATTGAFSTTSPAKRPCASSAAAPAKPSAGTVSSGRVLASGPSFAFTARHRGAAALRLRIGDADQRDVRRRSGRRRRSCRPASGRARRRRAAAQARR